MKILQKKIMTILCSLCLGIGFTAAPIHAEEVEVKDKKMYDSSEALVYHDSTKSFNVINVDTLVSPRAAYNVHKKVDFGVISATAYIDVDMNTGKIISTRIEKSNDKYFVLYNVSLNKTSTTAYFTITAYDKTIFGKLGKAIGTQYVTLNSGGIM